MYDSIEKWEDDLKCTTEEFFENNAKTATIYLGSETFFETLSKEEYLNMFEVIELTDDVYDTIKSIFGKSGGLHHEWIL